MVRDAQATRRRLLDAAVVEFAAHGIAGARVDRIAEAAQSNKAQIYHYFDSKDVLFDAAFNDVCVQFVSQSPIDVSDLSGYAGRIFDSFDAHPEIARLASWYRLERAGTQDPLQIVLDNLRDKVAKIAEAQRVGLLPARFSPGELMMLIAHLAETWSSSTPELTIVIGRTSREHRRQVVTDAVLAILAP